jgi:hypothetical protein
MDPVSGPLLLRKSNIAENQIRDLWICNHELWPLYHRGVHWVVEIQASVVVGDGKVTPSSSVAATNISAKVCKMPACAVAQAVNRRLLTATARIPDQESQGWDLWWPSFLQVVTLISLPIILSTKGSFHNYLPSRPGRIRQQMVSVLVNLVQYSQKENAKYHCNCT